MSNGSRNFGTVLVLGLLALPLPSKAQVPGSTAPPYSVLTAPEEVRACVCLEQGLQQLGAEVSARQRIYADRQQELSRLDAELARMRQSMNPENAAEVAAFRQLLDRRDATFNALSRGATDDYREAVDEYNRVVAQYNQRCYRRGLDPNVATAVRQNLVCPPAP
jgi:hypothetical protein